ncbi:MAG: ASCH domain-containing protein [Methylobacter sp.]|uniref:ASCH domain-containing protein n=1 Tax=Methylobacter sp. TaxID=2051955 RepID=UPI00258A2827|nr:ASCH domain-containing protein [Methylobacter sp.]MCL7422567.1 ASCH domain-containing protein [Methylobacter sp.]
MPKSISEQIRQQVIGIAARYGFAVQLKARGEDYYIKNLMFYSESLNQTVYVRKDRAVGAGGIPAYFHVAVHPEFFNKTWVLLAEGIEELINRQKNRNLHSSSNYKKFPVFPENNEPCGMCFKVADYEALAKLFQRMAGAENSETVAKNLAHSAPQSETLIASADNTVESGESPVPVRSVASMNKVPTKGLVIKSPYIEKILAGSKTWEMRSSATQVRGPIALIKKGSGQLVGVANLIDVKGALTRQDKLKAMDKHQIALDRLESGETDKWDTAWVLEGAQSLIMPINYHHPSGAVIWVNLDQQTQEKLVLAMQ